GELSRPARPAAAAPAAAPRPGRPGGRGPAGAATTRPWVRTPALLAAARPRPDAAAGPVLTEAPVPARPGSPPRPRSAPEAWPVLRTATDPAPRRRRVDRPAQATASGAADQVSQLRSTPSLSFPCPTHTARASALGSPAVAGAACASTEVTKPSTLPAGRMSSGIR